MYTPENKKSNGNKASVLQAKKSSTRSALSLPAVPVLQQKANDTGLPDNLRSGVEQLSGFAMDDVKVHYNSGKPAQLNALAYAQGTDIHVAPGQEKHLPHEAWHVAQQKQGRVQPTLQLEGLPVNDDAGLEHEADVMGSKSLQMMPVQQYKAIKPLHAQSKIVQFTPLTLPTRNAMLTAYNIPLDTNPGVTEELAAFLLGNVGYYRSIVNGDIPRFRQIITPYRASTNYKNTFKAMVEYNQLTGANKTEEGSLRSDANALAFIEFFAATKTMSAEEETGVKNYLAITPMNLVVARTGNNARNIRAMGKTMATGDPDQKRALIATATLPMLAVVLCDNGGRKGSIKNIPWGPGAAGGIPQNKNEHFSKHILRLAHPLNPDEYEPWKWMQLMGYNISKAGINGSGDVFRPAPLAPVPIPDVFNGDLIKSRFHSSIFFNVWLPGKAQAIAYLEGLHKDAYLNYVIASSSAINKGIVVNTGDEVKVLANAGEIFLAMKVVGNALTLSSGYIPLNDRVEEARGNAVAWDL